ncbi:MAG: membrane protein insertase YidC, partial [Akkermansiaceae bacterium]|nr:membrane protein insertase YidC [Akkermansiaceae bacterium]
MYDRKTWVVLFFCIALLGVNFHFSAKNREALEKAAAKEAAEEEESVEYLKETAKTTTGGLTVDTPPPPTEEETVKLGNDKITFTFSNIGGGIKYAEFAKEFAVGSESKKVRSNRNGPGPIGALANSSQEVINTPYAYEKSKSVAGKTAVYYAVLDSGLVIKKTYSLESRDLPGAPYLVNCKLTIENRGSGSKNLGDLSLFLGAASPLYQNESPNQTGFFWREDGDMHFKHGGKFKKKPVILSPADQKVRFAGVANQYFTTVIQPISPAMTPVWGKASKFELEEGEELRRAVRAGISLPSIQLQPGESKSLKYRIFVGPKQNTMLRQMENHYGEGWGDVMQYGMFWFISRPLNWLLNLYHDLIDSFAHAWAWGLAIIILTITVRIFIWPLHAKSTRTMKRMSKLKPKMDELREKYKDDPNKLNMETMGLYRKYGINPLGGCLPMLLQIPIFFGFFRMLQYAVELRGHGFLWVPDLSQPDTLTEIGLPFALPFLGDAIPV